MVVESGCLLKNIKNIKIKKKHTLKNDESALKSSSELISSCNVAKKRKIEEEMSSESSFSDNNDSILKDISRQLIEYKVKITFTYFTNYCYCCYNDILVTAIIKALMFHFL